MRRFCAVLTFLLVLSGCGSEEGFDERAQLPPAGFLRVIHAMPHAPDIAAEYQAQFLGSLGFGQPLAFQAVLPNLERTLRITYFDGTSAQHLISETFRVDVNHEVTVVVVGSLDAPDLIIIDNAPITTDTSDVAVQIVHASSRTPESLAFYLSSDGEQPTSPTSQVDQFGVSATIPTPPGEGYSLRATAVGSEETLYDSGDFVLIADIRPIFIVLDHFGPGGQTFRVASATDDGVFPFPLERLDSAARFANLVADSGPLDFYIDGELVNSGFEYQKIGGFHDLSRDEHTIVVTPAGEPLTVILDAVTTLESGSHHTLSVIGPVAEPVLAQSFDEFRRIEFRATLTVGDYSPTLNNLDVYVVPSGEDFLLAFPLVMALGQSDSQVFTPDEYDLVVTAAGSVVIDSGPHPLSLSGNGMYRIYVADAIGGGSPTIIVQGDDFAPPFDP